MNNFTFERQPTSKPITQTIKSLASADFLIAMNQVMAGQSLGQAKAITLLLQKDIEFEKLVGVKIFQTQMRDIARSYLDKFIPKILAIFTRITSFYNVFDSYYLDISELFNTLDETNETEKIGSTADVVEAVQELIHSLEARKNKFDELVIDLQKYLDDQLQLSDSLKDTQKIAEQLYIGEQAEIDALQTLLKSVATEINENNAQIVSGALHSTKNLLKIATSLVTEYIPDNPSKSDLPKSETKDIKNTQTEPTPIITTNIQLFLDNKPVPSFYQEKLQKALIQYRECIEKLKKYSIESTVYKALIQQWDDFGKNTNLMKDSVKYFAVAWQGLTQNFITLKQKLIVYKELDTHDIEYIKQQWTLTHDDLFALCKKAINFQNSVHLDVVSTIDTYDKNLLGIPRVKNGRLMQKIIAENSKGKPLKE